MPNTVHGSKNGVWSLYPVYLWHVAHHWKMNIPRTPDLNPQISVLTVHLFRWNRLPKSTWFFWSVIPLVSVKLDGRKELKNIIAPMGLMKRPCKEKKSVLKLDVSSVGFNRKRRNIKHCVLLQGEWFQAGCVCSALSFDGWLQWSISPRASIDVCNRDIAAHDLCSPEIIPQHVRMQLHGVGAEDPDKRSWCCRIGSWLELFYLSRALLGTKRSREINGLEDHSACLILVSFLYLNVTKPLFS